MDDLSGDDRRPFREQEHDRLTDFLGRSRPPDAVQRTRDGTDFSAHHERQYGVRLNAYSAVIRRNKS
jgi:hypothetical protein